MLRFVNQKTLKKVRLSDYLKPKDSVPSENQEWFLGIEFISVDNTSKPKNI